MSGLHLNHKVSWSDFAKEFRVYKDPGINFPVGECGLIHLKNKQIELQVNQRKYLQDKICLNSDCESSGFKIFRKSEKIKPVDMNMNLPRVSSTGLIHFQDNFKKAIREFAQTTLAKTERLKEVQKTTDIRKRLKENSQWTERSYDDSCPCRVFTILIELGDAKTLLSISHAEISSALSCQHGGQAVGNNFNFLRYYILTVYFYTNLIVALNLQDTPEKWNAMTPESYFRTQLMDDCDGQTFLYWSRKYLAPEVYMKDFEAMKQLCKDCFQFLYYEEMLRIEIGDRSSYDDDYWFYGIMRRYI